jgi:hypothetical protein
LRFTSGAGDPGLDSVRRLEVLGQNAFICIGLSINLNFNPGKTINECEDQTDPREL